ncbi:hypothetical protein V2O64_12185 [Verrucomicrobiaceae bacterium 227]
MKRALITTIILFLFVGFVCLERFTHHSVGKEKSQSKISAGNIPGPIPDIMVTASVHEQNGIRSAIPRSGSIDTDGTDPPPLHVTSISNQTPHPHFHEAGTLNSKLYFINSDQIPQNAETLNLDQLSNALREVAVTLGTRSLIFNKNGPSNQGFPFTLYANPKRNITPTVCERYTREMEQLQTSIACDQDGPILRSAK